MLLGGGVIGLIEFLIRRKDEKDDKNSEILKSISCLESKIDFLKTELNNKIDEIKDDVGESKAISCRVRILRFNDELQRDVLHTKDSWDQAMSDITFYENYCSTHKGFKNGQTAATIEYVSNEYRKRLSKHDFL